VDDIQERAVRLLEKTDVATRPVRLLGAGVHNISEPPGIDSPEGWLPF